MNKKKLFTFLLIMVSCPTMRTLDPIISLKTGVTTVRAKITNFFSNTKNVIWTGLATLLVVSSGIGLLYYNYKKKMHKSDKDKSIESNTIYVSDEDKDVLISLKNTNAVFPEENISDNPVELIQKYLPSIPISQEKKEEQEKTQNFQNILFCVYSICHLLDTLIEEHRNNNGIILDINFSNYYFPLILIQYLEEEMTKTIKTATQRNDKDNNLKNLIQFLGEKYCYISVNNKDKYPYIFSSNTFDIDQIDTSKNETIIIRQGEKLDEQCLFSILETIKKTKDPSTIENIITKIEKKTSLKKYIMLIDSNKKYINKIKTELNKENSILQKVTLIHNNFYEWQNELPANKIITRMVEDNRLPARQTSLARSGII